MASRKNKTYGEIIKFLTSFNQKKNLLDLRHQRNLNYFNIFAIGFITTTFSIVWAFILNQIEFRIFIQFLVVNSLIFVVALIVIKSRMDKTMSEIRNLNPFT